MKDCDPERSGNILNVTQLGAVDSDSDSGGLETCFPTLTVNPSHVCAAASQLGACFETTPVPTHTVGPGSWQSHCTVGISAVLPGDATKAASTLAHPGHV